MRIAIAGTRGVPARYGGFETFAEELSVRLVKRGHEVVVYERHALGAPRPQHQPLNGVIRRSTATIMQKYLETPLHALTTFWDLVFNPVDIVLLCNAANSPFSWIARIRGIPLVTNVDGIERMRSKWNTLGKLWYRLGETSAVNFSNKIIADAECIRRYYQETYQRDAAVIAYGATIDRKEPGQTLARFGLKPRNYILYVSRFEPENNALGVVEAYVRSKTHVPLVMVGDAPYATEYIAQVKAAANDRVIFTGFQFGDAYRELRSHALIAIQATEVGGTHPALVEAMAYGNCIIANRVPEHEEVLEDCGWYYQKNNFHELTKILDELLGKPELITQYGERAARCAARKYDWEVITDQYERLFKEVMGL